jgi:hypothetical protein
VSSHSLHAFAHPRGIDGEGGDCSLGKCGLPVHDAGGMLEEREHREAVNEGLSRRVKEVVPLRIAVVVDRKSRWRGV